MRSRRIRFPELTLYTTLACLILKKNYKTHKETKTYGPFTGKTEFDRNHPEEAQTLELLAKDVKSTILSILNKLMKTMDKPNSNQEKDV